jgi:hypothetical protein
MNITPKQMLILEIGDCKYKLKKEDPNSAYAVVLMARIKYLQEELTQTENNKPKVVKYVAPKPKQKFHYDPQGHYYEIWIDGELFLECTSCSADGPGNCGCWLTD